VASRSTGGSHAARSATRSSARATASRARASIGRHATAARSTRRGTAVAARGRAGQVSARGSRSVNSRVAAAVPYGRFSATSQGRSLRRTAMASCSTRHGRRTCSTTASRSEPMRWTGGLAPAAMSQAACPDGTIATMAIGHNDITRCVPL